ncbi:unnamed protein product [Durusdinium trenchii]|uniref:Anoctamin transmembrane domain-containing protein n=1 Tax=Durusdinium trenchii TaxID=1381693 RepID=A0ABP0SZ96_9DINO
MGAASDEWTLSDALRDGPEAERDCELGYISSAPEVLYQHTLDPSLSGATDLLSLIRNTVVALLARSGLIVELVFSSDFRWIYALISAGESALEELAAKHSYPRALDLECVDPEATEPCDAQYDPLSLVFQRHGCQEVVELLRALRPEERSSEATVPKGSSTPEDSVRDAYCWYLRSRLKGGKISRHCKEGGFSFVGTEEDLLQSTFDRLCGSHGPEVVRVSPGSAQVRHFQRLQVQRLDGKWVTSHFSREDRIMLTMAAVTDACDIFKLINDGYVVDVLPCKGSGEQNQEGQACALQLAWRRHMGAAIALPALLGMGAQVAVAWASEDWWAEILLGYACLTSLWFSIALAAWKLCRKRLLLSRGDVPGSDGSFDICCGSGFIRPAESVSRPFGSTRRQFFGSLKRSLITSNIEEQANPIFSCLRHGLIKLICVTLALASMVLAACTCDLLPINDENFNIPQIQYNVSQHVVALIVVLEIWLFNRVFRVLSLTMTRWENHKLRSDFVHAYHLKAVSLQLINSYASLFYIAFYPDSLKMFEVSYTCSYANGWWNHWGNACRMARLNKQLTTILAAFCLKVAFRCVALLLFSPTKKASQSLPERSSDILDLDHVMSAPRFGDPETDLNVVPSCCFSAASEVIIVLGMFLLFLPASPWTGLLTFIFLQLSNLALARSRRGIPWRAGHPFCHSADLLEASDRLAGTAIQAISWLAMLSMAALLVWPAQLGWGRLNAVLLINEGSDLAPWGVSCALLLVCRFLPGRFATCSPPFRQPRICHPAIPPIQDWRCAPLKHGCVGQCKKQGRMVLQLLQLEVFAGGRNWAQTFE